MKRLLEWFDHIYLILCIVLTALLASTVIISVFLRYVLGITFVWAEEVITMTFIGTTFFGSALALKEREHIRISFLVEHLSPLIQKILEVISLLATIYVVWLLFKTSLFWIKKSGSMVTPGLRLPERWFYYMVPVSAVLIIFYALRQLIGLFVKKRQAKTSNPPVSG